MQHAATSPLQDFKLTSSKKGADDRKINENAAWNELRLAINGHRTSHNAPRPSPIGLMTEQSQAEQSRAVRESNEVATGIRYCLLG